MADKIVTVNVGGVRYMTKIGTLTSYPDSLLAKMFTGKAPIDKDQDGNYFIDRDGEIFRLVLCFLRGEAIPDYNYKVLDLLRSEAKFYGLAKLNPIIDILRNEKLDNDQPSPAVVESEPSNIEPYKAICVLNIGYDAVLERKAFPTLYLPASDSERYSTFDNWPTVKSLRHMQEEKPDSDGSVYDEKFLRTIVEKLLKLKATPVMLPEPRNRADNLPDDFVPFRYWIIDIQSRH